MLNTTTTTTTMCILLYYWANKKMMMMMSLNKYEHLQRKWSLSNISRETFYVTTVLCLNIP